MYIDGHTRIEKPWRNKAKKLLKLYEILYVVVVGTFIPPDIRVYLAIEYIGLMQPIR